MAQAVAAGADRAIVTSDNPRHEEPRAIIDEVLAGFSRGDNVEACCDRAEAICRALADARPGDCVLVAGRGHEKYQIVGDRRIPLNDAEIARGWLYEFQPFRESV